MSETSAHPVHHGVENFEHTLTQKAGPLPVWAWGLGVGAVLVVFLWLHNRDSGPVTAYDNTAAMDGIDDGLSGSNAYDDAYQSGFSAGAGSGSGDLTDDTADANTDGTATLTGSGKGRGKGGNASWLRNAAAYLVGAGTAGPIKVSNALNRYLHGEPLNRQQRHIVNQAIRAQGLPPSAPEHVSTVSHAQHASNHAQGDHNVSPHTSNAQPWHGAGHNGGGHDDGHDDGHGHNGQHHHAGSGHRG